MLGESRKLALAEQEWARPASRQGAGVLNEGRRGQGGAASTSGRLDVTASRKWAASLQRFAKKRPGTCSKGHLCITKERFLNTACEGLAPVLNPKRGREPPGIPTIHSFNILLSTYSLPGLRAYLRLGVHMHFPALIVFPSFPPLPPLRPLLLLLLFFLGLHPWHTEVPRLGAESEL